MHGRLTVFVSPEQFQKMEMTPFQNHRFNCTKITKIKKYLYCFSYTLICIMLVISKVYYKEIIHFYNERHTYIEIKIQNIYWFYFVKSTFKFYFLFISFISVLFSKNLVRISNRGEYWSSWRTIFLIHYVL